MRYGYCPCSTTDSDAWSDAAFRATTGQNRDCRDQTQDGEERTRQEQIQREVARLKQVDSEVRAHEHAHRAVGGRYTGPERYDYTRGPDGRQYAVGGEVSIDVSKEQKPEATIAKMRVVRAAALAPAKPSSQDMQVAATASKIENEARQELARQTYEQMQNADSRWTSGVLSRYA
jgi:hypothetical protein